MTASRLGLAAALVLVYTVWGSTYLATKVALETIPPLLLTASRFLLAAGVLLILSRWAVRRRALPCRDEVMGVVVTGALMIGGGSTLLTLGQRTVDSGVASLVIAAVPLWVLLIGAAFGRRPPVTAVVGVFAGLGGLSVLLLGGGHDGKAIGMLLVLGSSVVWAVGSHFSQRLRLPADGLASAGWQMVVGGCIVTVLAVVSGEAWTTTAPVSGRSAVAWFYLTAVGTVVGYSAYVWLLQHASLRVATTYAYVNPVVALVLGAVVLGEMLSGRQIVAAAVVIAAVALVLASERQPRQRPAAVLPPGTAINGSA